MLACRLHAKMLRHGACAPGLLLCRYQEMIRLLQTMRQSALQAVIAAAMPIRQPTAPADGAGAQPSPLGDAALEAQHVAGACMVESHAAECLPPSTGAPGGPAWVYNSLNWTRTEVVALPAGVLPPSVSPIQYAEGKIHRSLCMHIYAYTTAHACIYMCTPLLTAAQPRCRSSQPPRMGTVYTNVACGLRMPAGSFAIIVLGLVCADGSPLAVVTMPGLSLTLLSPQSLGQQQQRSLLDSHGCSSVSVQALPRRQLPQQYGQGVQPACSLQRELDALSIGASDQPEPPSAHQGHDNGDEVVYVLQNSMVRMLLWRRCSSMHGHTLWQHRRVSLATRRCCLPTYLPGWLPARMHAFPTWARGMDPCMHVWSRVTDCGPVTLLEATCASCRAAVLGCYVHLPQQPPVCLPLTLPGTRCHQRPRPGGEPV